MFIAERLISIVAPHYCLVCDDEGALLCSWCAVEACASVPPRCYKCHRSSKDSAVCSACKRKTTLAHVWVRAEYGGTARNLLQKFKFERGQAAAKTIAELMHEALPYFVPDTLIVPVPTATSRVRGRGYDHAKLLAKELAKITQLCHEPLILRLGQTRQVGAKRQTRMDQLEGAFGLKKQDIKGKRILLVDDVVTTGATLEEAAKVLKQSGAKTIDAVVFAQKR